MPLCFQKLLQKRVLTFVISLFFVVLSGIFLLVKPIFALDLEMTAVNLLVIILKAFTEILASIILVVVDILIWVAQYNGFTDAIAVENGWVIVRDLSNMFFVVILLIIAFGTILGIQSYHYKSLLPKLILMAVLINFSKLICGVLIDAAQVVMLTFVNGFKAAAGGNIVEGLGLKKAFTIDASTPEVSGGTLFGSYLLALIMVAVTLVVLVVMVGMLIARIVMIWLLVVLSPLAFLLSSLPQGKGKADKWWGEFSKNVIVGPVLAFFLWLSLLTVGATNASDQFKVAGEVIKTADHARVASVTEFGSADTILSFIVGIAILLAGLKMAAEMGAAGSGLASSALNKIKRTGSSALMLPLKAAWATTKFGVKAAESKLYAHTGVGLDPRRQIKAWKEYSERKQRDEERAGAVKSMTKTQKDMREGKYLKGYFRSFMGTPNDFFQNYMGWRGVKNIANIVSGRGEKEGQKLIDEAGNDKKLAGEKEKEAGRIITSQERGDIKKQREDALQKSIESGKIDIFETPQASQIIQAQIEKNKQEAQKLRTDGKKEDADILELENKDLQELVDKQEPEINFEKFSFANAITESLTREKDKLDKKLTEDFEVNDAGKKAQLLGEAKDLRKNANDKENKAASLMPPSFYYTEQQRRSMEDEELKKLPSHAMDANELIMHARSALAEKSRGRFMAIFKKLAQDGNDGDLYESFGYSKDASGADQFRKKVMVDKLGMDEQESKVSMSDVNALKTAKGNFSTTFMYSQDAFTGKYGEFDDPKQQKLRNNLIASLIGKMPARERWSKVESLNFGTVGPDKKFKLGVVGRLVLTKYGDSLKEQLNKRPQDVNTDLLEKFHEILPELEKMDGISKDLIKAIRQEGNKLRGKFKNFDAMIDSIHQETTNP